MEESGVTIVKMYNWFNDIIKNLKGLWKVIVKVELNQKLLSLHEELRPKFTAIEEDKDLSSMTMEELVKFFITHEHTLKIEKDEMENNMKKKKEQASRSSCNEKKLT